MRSFSEMTPQEGVEKLTLLLSRITLTASMEDSLPLRALASVVGALNTGDVSLAVYEYHKFFGALMNCGARRVSGDIFKDFLISVLIEGEHPFAKMAAAEKMDRALYSAMRKELSVLGELSSVTSADITRLIAERAKELRLRTHHAKDNIALMSTAVWSGGSTRPTPKEETPLSPPPPSAASVPQDGEWHTTRYDVEPADSAYVADEALEEIYAKLNKTSVWANLIEDLYGFFAAYGTGAFLRDRAFTYSMGALMPMRIKTPPLPVSFYEAQRIALMDNTISFMRGDAADNICVYGGAGTGKTCMMQSLLSELPEVRLIALCDSAFAGERIMDTLKLVEALREQPLRFILLIDGADMGASGVKEFLKRAELAGLPENVLLYAALREEPDCSIFGECIAFPYPKPQEFQNMVMELLSADGCFSDADEVRNACVDERAASRDCLSLISAMRVAKRCIEGR